MFHTFIRKKNVTITYRHRPTIYIKNNKKNITINGSYSTSKTIEMGFLFYRYSSKGNWVHQFRGNLKFEKFICLMKTRFENYNGFTPCKNSFLSLCDIPGMRRNMGMGITGEILKTFFLMKTPF